MGSNASLLYLKIVDKEVPPLMRTPQIFFLITSLLSLEISCWGLGDIVFQHLDSQLLSVQGGEICRACYDIGVPCRARGH